jgi:hypothetical protein
MTNDLAGRRSDLVAGIWTEDGTYLDPRMSGTGHAEIAAMIGAAQRHFAGHRFELSFGPDAHHDRVRFGWRLLGPVTLPWPPAWTSRPLATAAACTR